MRLIHLNDTDSTPTKPMDVLVPKPMEAHKKQAKKVARHVNTSEGSQQN